MALEIDAFDVLRAIAAEPSTFAGIRAEIAKETGKFTDKLRDLLVKCVKASAGDIGAVRSIRRALGPQTFDLLIEGMKDSDLKTIVGKLDEHHPQQKVANADWRRGHLRALATEMAEPSEAPPKKLKSTAPKSKSKPKPPGVKKTAKRRRREVAAEEYLEDPSAGAVRKDRR